MAPLPAASTARINTIQGRMQSGNYDQARMAKMKNRVNRLQGGGAVAQPGGGTPQAATPPATGIGTGQIIGESNPFGSQVLKQDENGNTTIETNMDPGQKGILDQQVQRDTGLGGIAQGQIGGVQSAYANPLDISGIGNDPRTMDFSADRQRIEQGYVDRFNQLNGDRFKQEQDANAQSLANRGIATGSDLYNRELERLNRQQGDERQSAIFNAMDRGGAEMQRSYSMGADARDRSINETLMQRDRPYQELANVMSGIQGPVMPQFNNILDSNLALRGQRQQEDQFGQSMGFQRKESALDRKQRNYLANLNRGGRGGGGGGGAGPEWQQMGFSSPMEYVQWQTEQNRANKQWDYANNPQFQQPKQPSFGSQLVGALVGAGTKGLGDKLGSKVYDYLPTL